MIDVFLLLSSNAQAITAVYDHFNDGGLDPAWSITFQDNATGWTYAESGTNLEVTDIVPNVVYPMDGASWAIVKLSQTFTPLTDFNVDFDISWDSEGRMQAMQELLIRLYDSGGSLISLAGYGDAWVGNSGGKTGMAGANHFSSGQGTLPLTGSASIDISRVSSNVDVLWDSVGLVSGTSTAPISRVDLEFYYYAYSGGGGSFFGNESIDLVNVEGTPIPEPATLLLVGLGGLAVLRKRRKKIVLSF